MAGPALNPVIDSGSPEPIYRQISAYVRAEIAAGRLAEGERLPTTRDLAESLGLNRATISAAYSLLEAEGYLSGQVGRGSFVATPPAKAEAPAISFQTSRPSQTLFPLEDFRRTCAEVLEGPGMAQILQLGSPAGYAPLRRYLLEQARAEGIAGRDDDILITNGCQQGFDLAQRVLTTAGDIAAVEDPVYPGIKNVFERAGLRIAGVPVGPTGIDLAALDRILNRDKPRILVVTPSFQNPYGTTMPESARREMAAMARAYGVRVVENHLYAGLRYTGPGIAPVKALPDGGDTLLLSSFSKVAFPGLRVGWIIGPRRIIAQLTEAKQWSDLHTDQLSQAVLLRFAESGRLDRHRQEMLREGGERLRAALAGCEAYLPEGSEFTRPEGGMNLWVRLPAGLDAERLLPATERRGVSYLPGSYFAVSRRDPAAFRLSFAGIEPPKIALGLAKLGEVFREGLDHSRRFEALETAPAMV